MRLLLIVLIGLAPALGYARILKNSSAEIGSGNSAAGIPKSVRLMRNPVEQRS